MGERRGRRCEHCARAAGCPATNYDHVHRVARLPLATRSDTHSVRHGYAVELGEVFDPCLMFFIDLAPALAFGRAGRKSSLDLASYGVFTAARERHHTDHHDDTITLHLAGSNLDPDDAALNRLAGRRRRLLALRPRLRRDLWVSPPSEPRRSGRHSVMTARHRLDGLRRAHGPRLIRQLSEHH